MSEPRRPHWSRNRAVVNRSRWLNAQGSCSRSANPGPGRWDGGFSVDIAGQDGSAGRVPPADITAGARLISGSVARSPTLRRRQASGNREADEDCRASHCAVSADVDTPGAEPSAGSSLVGHDGAMATAKRPGLGTVLAKPTY